MYPLTKSLKTTNTIMTKYCNIGSIGAGNKFIAAGKVGYVIANKANCVRVAYNGKRQNFEYMNIVSPLN
jgi:hypothetical protein